MIVLSGNVQNGKNREMERRLMTAQGLELVGKEKELLIRVEFHFSRTKFI